MPGTKDINVSDLYDGRQPCVAKLERQSIHCYVMRAQGVLLRHIEFADESPTLYI